MSRRTSTIGVVLAGLAVAVILAFFVSPNASSNPDGLEKVAADKALDTGGRASAVADGPLADYSMRGIDDAGLSTGLAGVVGVIVAFGLAYGLTTLVRHRAAVTAAPEHTA